MPQQLYIVDAFASHRFEGNPAAVCVLREPKSLEWMQSVATELNLSETAFVRQVKDLFELKWFTPSAEVSLCGHATLAAAHVIWETGILPLTLPIVFKTLSGRLSAEKTAAWISLDFPALGVEAIEEPEGLIEAIGVVPQFVGKSRFDILIEVATEREVNAASPNIQTLAAYTAIRGVIVTAKSASVEYDFVSRFFAPSIGVSEDPVTGSAHCCLAPYWSAKLGRKDLCGYQASRRGGTVRTSLRASRVQLSGQAVTVVNGTLI